MTNKIIMKDLFNMFFSEEDRKWWHGLSRKRKLSTSYLVASMCVMIVVATSEDLAVMAVAGINLALAVAIYALTEN